jgi:signal transduction histidine kinase
LHLSQIAEADELLTHTPLPAGAQVALTRAAQEALVNAAKHAQGQPVHVRLDYGDDSIVLTVRNHLDNPARRPGPTTRRGARFATADGGYGLAGMRERLLLQDGTLIAGPDGAEWSVVATVPRGRQDERLVRRRAG